MKKLDTLKCAYMEAKNLYENALDKYKRKSGVLKEGEWLKVSVYIDENNLKPDETIILYCTPSDGVVAMNTYLASVEGGYISEIISQAPRWETWKAEKISKEEAIKYL